MPKSDISRKEVARKHEQPGWETHMTNARRRRQRRSPGLASTNQHGRESKEKSPSHHEDLERDGYDPTTSPEPLPNNHTELKSLSSPSSGSHTRRDIDCTEGNQARVNGRDDGRQPIPPLAAAPSYIERNEPVTRSHDDLWGFQPFAAPSLLLPYSHVTGSQRSELSECTVATFNPFLVGETGFPVAPGLLEPRLLQYCPELLSANWSNLRVQQLMASNSAAVSPFLVAGAFAPAATSCRHLKLLLEEMARTRPCNNSAAIGRFQPALVMATTKSEDIVRANTNRTWTGVTLECTGDHGMLNDHLIFLRQQIEFFQATADDIMSHTRGRNKGIALHQVGMRCRHCSHIPAGQRRKGSTYFPSTLMGVYQAAQNINVEHLQSGLCPEMPRDEGTTLLTTRATKTASSGVGKAYWAESARTKGLVDTHDGIRFLADAAANGMLHPASAFNHDQRYTTF